MNGWKILDSSLLRKLQDRNALDLEARDRERAVTFITDVTFRFINPLTIRLDSDMPDEFVDTRLGALIRAILRTLANGYV